MNRFFLTAIFLATTIGLIADLGHRIKDLSSAQTAGKSAQHAEMESPSLGAQKTISETEVMPHESPTTRDARSSLGLVVSPQSDPTGGIDPKEMASDLPDPKDMKEMLTADDAQPQAPLAFPAGGSYGVPNLGSPHSRIPTSPVAVPEPGVGICLAAGIFIGYMVGIGGKR